MPIVSAALALAACVVLSAPAVNETAADVVTLRDGKTVCGEMIEPWNPGSVGLHVRRAWVRSHLPDWADRWEAAEAPFTRRASAQRRERLDVWRRDRAAAPVKDDRITAWIDRELNRQEDAGGDSPLLIARLARTDVRSVVRAPKGASRWLRMGWLSNFPNPETMRVEDLKGALEGRGFDLSTRAAVSLDALLPPRIEADSVWLVRRAATEVAYDPDLRFVRHQGLVLPNSEPGQTLDSGTAAAGLSALKDLLSENRADPLTARLRAVENRGRVGALVTRLDVAPDFSLVTVEMALWVRQKGERWVMAGSQQAHVRPGDLAPGVTRDLAEDPQVAQAFQVVEALGLGTVSSELKQRSLAIGAATRKALGQARMAANADLARLALPILERPKCENARKD